MISAILILLPLITGAVSFAIRSSEAARRLSFFSALITLGVAIGALLPSNASMVALDLPWLPVMGSRFALSMDGMSKMLCLLTALSFPVIFLASFRQSFRMPGAFYGWMLLSQAGLMGVFLAADALLFYFFWEMVLIPVYFLCSTWGGERRIAVTIKFFLYTFIGSLLMLAGIIYLSFQMPTTSFAISDITQAAVNSPNNTLLFFLFFIAFAIKMPVFPLHTWQPEAYEESPSPVTMVMSGVMVKMGIYAVIRWLLPLFPSVAEQYASIIIAFAVAGMLYASLIAMQQNNLRRLIAYSSIAHIGLMAAALFTSHAGATQGVMLQMFSHGVNVIGLWILADAIEKITGTRQLNEMGGLARKAPRLAILLVVMGLANVALPLTNAFVGEFMMFNGLFHFNWLIAAAAGISIILAAVYTLRMIEKVLYGSPVNPEQTIEDLTPNVTWALVVLVVLVLIGGIYPQPLIDLTKDTVETLTLKK